MDNPRKRRAMGKVRHQSLIKRMIDGDCAPAELASELGLTLEDLAYWASDPRNIAALAHLAQLADIRAQIVVSQYRATAAAQLIQIATSSTQSDLARKACVDFLNADLSAFDPPHVTETEGASSHDAPPRDAASILAALEHIGQRSLNDLGGAQLPS